MSGQRIVTAHEMYGTLAQLLVNKATFSPVHDKPPELVTIRYTGRMIESELKVCCWFTSKSRDYLIPISIMERFGLTHPRAHEPPSETLR